MYEMITHDAHRVWPRWALERAAGRGFVGWIRASFKPADQVVLKIDVEGVEHEIFEALTQGGGWDPELTRTLRGLRWVAVRGEKRDDPLSRNREIHTLVGRHCQNSNGRLTVTRLH
jgi:hypothetical protein